jgi:hypothetical protein
VEKSPDRLIHTTTIARRGGGSGRATQIPHLWAEAQKLQPGRPLLIATVGNFAIIAKPERLNEVVAITDFIVTLGGRAKA